MNVPRMRDVIHHEVALYIEHLITNKIPGKALNVLRDGGPEGIWRAATETSDRIYSSINKRYPVTTKELCEVVDRECSSEYVK